MIAYDNEDAANRFLESAEAAFEVLARMLRMGVMRRFSPERLQNLRSFRVKNFKNYVIFNEPLTDGINVFHVLHGARDLEQFFDGQ
jgi:toxin ParE1/3/4